MLAAKLSQTLGVNIISCGGEKRYVCPKCDPIRKNKGRKDLSVNSEKGTWKCHHCDYHGAVFPDKEEAPKKPRALNGSFDMAADWLSRRGITPEVSQRNKCQVKQGALALPFVRHGEHVNTKYRKPGKVMHMESGAELTWYKYDDMVGQKLIYVVEGEIDALSAEVAGFKNCISVPNGAPSPTAQTVQKHFEYIDKSWQDLQHVKHFVLAVDNDVPGVNLKHLLARRFGMANCYEVRWPEGCKDANDVLMKHGVDKLRECLLKHHQYMPEGISNPIDYAKEVQALRQGYTAEKFSTGWANMDDLLQIVPGYWTVVTGVPNHGKSEFLDAMLCNMAEMHGFKMAVFSPENQPMERYCAKLIEKYGMAPFDEMPLDMVQRGLNWVNRHFRFISLDDPTLEGILDRIELCVKTFGINAAVIDPWNEIEHKFGRESETQYISRALTRMRRLARDNNIHLFVVAHPAKLQKNKNDGKYPVPSAYDIAGSAHWYNKADNIIVVHRQPNHVEIVVQKVRFKTTGKPGNCFFTYDIRTGRYSEYEIEENE